jgi:thiamine-phosphate pyrophosphorylase
MNNTMKVTSGIYAITDCENIDDHEVIEKSKQILSVGISLFQYRNKTKDKKNKKELALELQSLCLKYDTPFIINDDVDLAKELNADGVHLGQNDEGINNARKKLGSKIIGISCYNDLNRAVEAEKAGADYIAFGSFFPSVTKPDARKVKIELLNEAESILTIPIVAIGGITPENGKLLIDAKADFLAIISGLYSATNTINATQTYNNLFN